MEQFLCLLLHFIKETFWIREKTRGWVNLIFKKASKIVHSYVLKQMFLSLACCVEQKKRVKLQLEALQQLSLHARLFTEQNQRIFELNTNRLCENKLL